ncbi:MAG: holo-ACP synthase [Burkholderiales bacterium]|nr:holo-ACP synthase [Burkholderiales bacterium]
MIYGVGHDIVENKRIAYLWHRFGNRFIEKILSKAEIATLDKKPNLALFLAKRFAAKEAFAKACGTGVRSPILLPSVTIVNDAEGKPSFEFNPAINAWLDKRQITHCHLSISDEVNLSSAFVILEII